MPIEMSCTGCGQTLRVADEHAGKKARCPACGTIAEVPWDGAEVQPVEEPSNPFSPASQPVREPSGHAFRSVQKDRCSSGGSQSKQAGPNPRGTRSMFRELRCKGRGEWNVSRQTPRLPGR